MVYFGLAVKANVLNKVLGLAVEIANLSCVQHWNHRQSCLDAQETGEQYRGRKLFLLWYKYLIYQSRHNFMKVPALSLK